MLDEVHKRKIDASDAVVLLNVFSYIGESTLSEIGYSFAEGKPVYPLESWAEGMGVGMLHDQVERDATMWYEVNGINSPMSTCYPPFKSIAALYDLLNGYQDKEPPFATRRRLMRLVSAEQSRILHTAGALQQGKTPRKRSHK